MGYVELQHQLENRSMQFSFWKRHWHSMLRTKIPRRFKRLIFLSSVLGVISNHDDFDKEIITKLNNVLKLAHNQEAIVFPMYINSWMWKTDSHQIHIDGNEVSLNDLKSKVLTWDDFKQIAEYFIRLAPDWVIYGSLHLLAKDLEVMFRNTPWYSVDTRAVARV